MSCVQQLSVYMKIRRSDISDDTQIFMYVKLEGYLSDDRIIISAFALGQSFFFENGTQLNFVFIVFFVFLFFLFFWYMVFCFLFSFFIFTHTKITKNKYFLSTDIFIFSFASLLSVLCTALRSEALDKLHFVRILCPPAVSNICISSYQISTSDQRWISA